MSALLKDRRSGGALVRLLGLALGVWLLALAWATPVHAQEVIEYYGTDHLGSVRVVFDAAGTVIARADYLPYGEEVFAPTGTMPAQKFTGQARDAEAGQDYFHARMYQPRAGRFTAVDAVFNAASQPQKWNRYAYALNNPLVFTDPSGNDAEGPEGGYSCRVVTPNMGGCVYIPNSAVIVPQGIHGEGSQIGTMSEAMAESYAAYGANETYKFWFDVIDRANPQSTEYETADAAAARVNPSMTMATAVTTWEWGKNIYFDPRTGSFLTGAPMTSGLSDTFLWGQREADAKTHRGQSWVGIYHTHPADLTGGYMNFSGPDKDAANRSGRVSYVGSPGGYLFKYDPATGRINPVK